MGLSNPHVLFSSLQNKYMQLEKAIVTTILYSDIFHFPLKKEELWYYLISKEQFEKADFEKALALLCNSHILRNKDGFYCLWGQEKNIIQRKKMLPEVKKKLALAYKAASLLSFIPSIRFIGLSGGLATGNVTKSDDIDFFIITQKKTLFVTRALVLAVLEWKKLRRKRRATYVANTICVNLFFDETQMQFSRMHHDVYIAREIAQVQPLFERHNTYQKFLQKNKWITQFLPNASFAKSVVGKQWQTTYYSLRFFLSFGRLFEPFVRYVQMQFMKNHQTIELVTKTRLALHPNNYRSQTLQLLRSKCKEFGLLT